MARKARRCLLCYTGTWYVENFRLQPRWKASMKVSKGSGGDSRKLG